jgi:hypothetical protein
VEDDGVVSNKIIPRTSPEQRLKDRRKQMMEAIWQPIQTSPIRAIWSKRSGNGVQADDTERLE